MKKLDIFLPAAPEQEMREEIDAAPYLKSFGYIKYDPKRPGMKRRTEWWSILEVPGGIADYYRNMVEKRYGIELCQPSWGAHVSIIRGEKPRDDLMHLWKKYDGKRVEFEYAAYPRYNGDTRVVTKHDSGAFWFLDVHCEFLTDIRKELELPYDWKLHLTIGRRWS